MRLSYWAVLAWLMVRLQPLRPGVLGLASLAGSEVLDIIGNDGVGTAAVEEEFLACGGAWAIVMATVGVALSTLTGSGEVLPRLAGT